MKDRNEAAGATPSEVIERSDAVNLATNIINTSGCVGALPVTRVGIHTLAGAVKRMDVGIRTLERDLTAARLRNADDDADMFRKGHEAGMGAARQRIEGLESDLRAEERGQDNLRRALESAESRLAEVEAERDAERARLDWMEDPARCYWVTIQSQPSGEYFRSGQGVGLRDAIDTAIRHLKEKS